MYQAVPIVNLVEHFIGVSFTFTKNKSTALMSIDKLTYLP